jgi:hypothetical protein
MGQLAANVLLVTGMAARGTPVDCVRYFRDLSLAVAFTITLEGCSCRVAYDLNGYLSHAW